MSFKIPNGVDLVQSEIQNAKAQNLGSDPSSPGVGQFWFNTATQKLMYRDSSGNRDVTYLAQVLLLRLDQFAAPTADVSMNSHKITNLTDGSSAQDAVTYNQLLTVLQGRSFKDAVRVATTGNITLSGTQTIDGISVVAGDRVLVKNQTTASSNGIYIVATGAWTRSTDADASSKVPEGMSVQVSEGTALGDTQWTLTTNAPITLGTTSLAFAQTGAGTTYTQGNGISISGNTIAVDPTVTARKFSQDIGDGSSTSIAVTHNLGTVDVQAKVRLKSTNEEVLIDNVATSTNVVTFTFGTAPASATYRVTIIG